MTSARKRRIWQREGGRCRSCGEGVPMEGDGVVYDHVSQLWMGGAEHDDNVYPLCSVCNKIKTRDDAKRRAKVKRLQKIAPQKTVRGRSDESGLTPPADGAKGATPRHASRKLRSRGFQTKLRKRMSGEVVKR